MYIDADKLLKKLPEDLPYKASVRRVLMQAPTADVVEVVRCKKCKNFIEKGEEYLLNKKFGFCKKSRTGFFDDGEEVYEDDFCSYGGKEE